MTEDQKKLIEKSKETTLWKFMQASNSTIELAMFRGDATEESIKKAGKMIDKFIDEELNPIFGGSGLGNVVLGLKMVGESLANSVAVGKESEVDLGRN